MRIEEIVACRPRPINMNTNEFNIMAFIFDCNSCVMAGPCDAWPTFVCRSDAVESRVTSTQEAD